MFKIVLRRMRTLLNLNMCFKREKTSIKYPRNNLAFNQNDTQTYQRLVYSKISSEAITQKYKSLEKTLVYHLAAGLRGRY